MEIYSGFRQIKDSIISGHFTFGVRQFESIKKCFLFVYRFEAFAFPLSRFFSSHLNVNSCVFHFFFFQSLCFSTFSVRWPQSSVYSLSSRFHLIIAERKRKCRKNTLAALSRYTQHIRTYKWMGTHNETPTIKKRLKRKCSTRITSDC